MTAPERPKLIWTPTQDALLGKSSDAEVAFELGRPLRRVAYRRRQLGIPAGHAPPGSHRVDGMTTLEIAKMLAENDDGAVAILLSWTRERVRFLRRQAALNSARLRPLG